MKQFSIRLSLALIVGLTSDSVMAQSGITWSAPMSVAASSYENQHPRITLTAVRSFYGVKVQQPAPITRAGRAQPFLCR